MNGHTRRGFMNEVGKGMLVAGVGSGLAMELGLVDVMAKDGGGKLTFGKLEPLVGMMQEIELSKLQPALVKKMSEGVTLKTLMAAGALANARSFGGQDYIGYHTMMAMMPAWEISKELKGGEKVMPLFKVLYRNTARIQAANVSERLALIEAAKLKGKMNPRERLSKAMLDADMKRAERTFAAMKGRDRNEVFNAVLSIVQDAPDVHRVTLAWRSWDAMELVGYEHGHTLLRQSLRYCVAGEADRLRRNRPVPVLRTLLPKLLDDYKLLGRKIGTRKADGKWIEAMAKTLFSSSRDGGAEAVAEALKEGFGVEDIGEAMSLGANLLVLNDPGRKKEWASKEKPAMSVHGASVGVHASDAANAWRNISRVADARNVVCSLIVGAWHTAGQTGHVTDKPFAYDVEALKAKKLNAGSMVNELKAAVESRDQAKAMAVVKGCELAGYGSKGLFDCLRGYAVSEDGALHAEKYFRTVTEEFGGGRKEFRWRHLVGLARVTASEFGWPAPGREQARKLLPSQG